MCAGMGRRKFPAKKILYFKYSGIYVAEIMHNNYVAEHDLCTSVYVYVPYSICRVD